MFEHNLRVQVCLILLSICLLLAACTSSDGNATPQSDAGGVYRPPPAAPPTPLVIPLPSSTPTASDLSQGFVPTATPTCFNDLRFLADLTFPDGTQVPPGAEIDKRWQIENAGTCNWNKDYRLRMIQGPSLSAVTEQSLYPARSGTQAVIRISFTAPREPGAYRSAWQAHNPQGEAFGDIIYLDIAVVGETP